MKYKVVISMEAENDLRRVYEYIALELRSSNAALRQLNHLEKAIVSLSEMPYRFREYDSGKWKNRRLRIMPVDNYCIFYIPDDNTKTVTVIRIVYGSRDLLAVLNENESI